MPDDRLPEYHDRFDSAFKEELQYVKARWLAKEERRWEEAVTLYLLREAEAQADGEATPKPPAGQPPGPESFDPDRLAGLALSGGGIRSASFCMGVVQQMHAAGLMDRFHYMSTVSGGGYTGCSLTWFLSQGFGTREDNFPFWGGSPAALRNAGDSVRQRRTGPLDGRTVLDYIRQRSSYLNPGAGFTAVSAIAIVLRSTLTSLFGFILLGALFLWLAVRLRLFDHPLPPLGLDIVATGGLICLGLLAASVIYYSLATGIPQQEREAYDRRRLYQRWAGTVLTVGLVLLGLSLLDELMDGLREGPNLPKGSAAMFGMIASALGAAGGLVARGGDSARPGILKTVVMAVVPVVSLVLLLAGIGILARLFAEAAVARGLPGLGALFLLTLIYCITTNVNLTGLHRFYRDRLMETFMPDAADILADGQAAQTDADAWPLAEICGPETDGPYHLINAHVVLLGATKARQRSRSGDGFVLSRLYCGSEATGFIATADWAGAARRFGLRPIGPMRLPSAMAISGAALNPRAGGDGEGATKGGVVSALLTILNLRLGFWAPSPAKVASAKRGNSYRWPPNFIRPGVVQGLFGFAHSEKGHWLELTDGGHFENTAIYELIRRRVLTIVFADGSTDPEISLSSFANLLQKIYVDFGVTVTFGEPADFTRMMKGSAIREPGDVLSERLQLSASAYSVGTIRYPETDGRPAMTGTLFYIKSTMTQGLPPGLYSYKASNPLFPSESLAEQFFSEQQFEAYRALGFAQAASMVEEVRKRGQWALALGFPPPKAAVPEDQS